MGPELIRIICQDFITHSRICNDGTSLFTAVVASLLAGEYVVGLHFYHFTFHRVCFCDQRSTQHSNIAFHVLILDV